MDVCMYRWMDGGTFCGGNRDQNMGIVVRGGGGEGKLGGGQLRDKFCREA